MFINLSFISIVTASILMEKFSLYQRGFATINNIPASSINALEGLPFQELPILSVWCSISTAFKITTSVHCTVIPFKCVSIIENKLIVREFFKYVASMLILWACIVYLSQMNNSFSILYKSYLNYHKTFFESINHRVINCVKSLCLWKYKSNLRLKNANWKPCIQ